MPLGDGGAELCGLGCALALTRGSRGEAGGGEDDGALGLTDAGLEALTAAVRGAAGDGDSDRAPPSLAARRLVSALRAESPSVS